MPASGHPPAVSVTRVIVCLGLFDPDVGDDTF